MNYSTKTLQSILASHWPHLCKVILLILNTSSNANSCLKWNLFVQERVVALKHYWPITVGNRMLNLSETIRIKYYISYFLKVRRLKSAFVIQTLWRFQPASSIFQTILAVFRTFKEVQLYINAAVKRKNYEWQIKIFFSSSISLWHSTLSSQMIFNPTILALPKSASNTLPSVFSLPISWCLRAEAKFTTHEWLRS